MPNQKLENLLNLSLDATEEERSKSSALRTGYDQETNLWEVIVRHTGSLSSLWELSPSIRITELLGGFSIVTLPAAYLSALSALPNVTFVEKPKRLFFAVSQARQSSCITPLYEPPWELDGSGILVGIVDSGVALSHPDFRNDDGSTRFLRFWDQTLDGSPPEGYFMGTEWTSESINEALSAGLSLPQDPSGHGTAVAGIAAGNGSASQGRYAGIAPQASLIGVKLGTPRPSSFPRTTQLMMGIDYCVKTAASLNMPLALNLSFGNNYGSHDGTSLLESYLNIAAGFGRVTICIGSGNEGASAIHASSVLSSSSETVELSVGNYETSLTLQLWKYYADQFTVSLETPTGLTIGPIIPQFGTQRLFADGTELLIFYGEPSPFSTSQEIYLDFIPSGSYLNGGIWKIHLTPQQIVNGTYHMWLPGGGVLNQNTRFLSPSPDTTLTIPSTASHAIAVGAYDSALGTYADFSGRGFTRYPVQIKPDLAAPGVGLMAPAAPDLYAPFTGTSFATPVVTGSAALMMQWGMVRGNDPYLYGEKVKAYFIKGARRLPGSNEYPNPRLGYGVLCLRNSFPYI